MWIIEAKTMYLLMSDVQSVGRYRCIKLYALLHVAIVHILLEYAYSVISTSAINKVFPILFRAKKIHV